MLHGLARGKWSLGACRFMLGLGEPGNWPGAGFRFPGPDDVRETLTLGPDDHYRPSTGQHIDGPAQ